MVALRLFLPESWTGDLARLKCAGVPLEYQTTRTKPAIALAEIDRVTAAGVRFGCVLADAGYGLSAPFRQGLTARNLAWAVGIPRHLKVYPVDVRLIWPATRRGRPRRRHVPDILSMPAEDMLAGAKWQMVSWRTGTKGKLKARFAAVRVRTADGPAQRIRDKGQQHLPGDEAWLIGEHRSSGEKKYYLANLPAATDLRTLAATIKARWICEQAHQQLKEELPRLRVARQTSRGSSRPSGRLDLLHPNTIAPVRSLPWQAATIRRCSGVLLRFRCAPELWPME